MQADIAQGTTGEQTWRCITFYGNTETRVIISVPKQSVCDISSSVAWISYSIMLSLNRN